MPVAHVVCPHCETPVELQVTTVTRSRPCPKCGELVFLQVAEKEQRVKRRALLVTPTGAVDFDAEDGEKVFANPQPLPGDAFERMRQDPEILQTRKKLIIGLMVVGALVAAAGAYEWYRLSHPAQAVDAAASGSETDAAGKADGSEASASTQVLQARKILDELEGLGGVSVATRGDDGAAGLAFKPVAESSSGANPGVGQGAGAAATAGARDLRPALEALAGFLKAASVDERLRHVLDRPYVEQMMRSYYQKSADGPITFDRVDRSFDLGRGVSEHLVVLGEKNIRRAVVVETPEGPKVDWPSFVVYSEMDWQEFIASKPSRPVLFRLVASAADHYEGGFRDSTWVRCVRLSKIDAPNAPSLFGYVERRSIAGQALENWLREAGDKPFAITVRLKYPFAAEVDDQVWIADVLANGWVIRPGRK